MALIKRGNVWHVRVQIAGVMIARSTKTSNKRQAEMLEAKWVNEVHSEVVVAGRRPVTVQRAFEVFLESRRGTAGYESCAVKLRAFDPFLKRQLTEVTAAELRARALELVDEGYSINTINVSIIYWNAIQNHCTKAGYTAGVKIKRLKGGEGRVRFLSDTEVDQLLAALDPESGAYRERRKAQDNLDFTVLLLHTGAREQEIARLKLSQIDQAAGTITIHRSKGGTDTTLKMSRAVVELVARRMVAAEAPLPEGQSLHGRADETHLFPERAKGRYNNEFINKAAARAGLRDVTCHVMRHTFACRMLRAGLSLNEVQHLLGHRHLTSTMRYAHLVPNLTATRAAEVLDAS
ncbi:tyrosine-type recombinase/integrase [Leptothrix discophora]|uniref:Site-specific integrase n=1 Tax=Leptothrix discophora TaxID=89 RepID=A0ABT9G0E4_LEPDI|nr:site-specific integrase [Leptothrix discophora]MDP4299953.1 site-specific integrase [Leptothrix discophora]